MDRYEIRRRPSRLRETSPAYQPESISAPAYTVTMGDRGRLVLPLEVREQLKIKEGDRLTLRVEADGAIRLQTADAFARSLLGAFKHLAPGRILSDELIAERRREAAIEDRKDRAHLARERRKTRR
jgi:AbrB family looped-hinge helix DNA binding protein